MNIIASKKNSTFLIESDSSLDWFKLRVLIEYNYVTLKEIVRMDDAQRSELVKQYVIYNGNPSLNFGNP